MYPAARQALTTVLMVVFGMAHSSQICFWEWGQEREVPVCQFRPALAQNLGYNGGAPGTNHKPRRTGNDQQGHHKIHRRKGELSRKVGHEQAVHYAVDGGKDHHDDGRHGEAQQLRVGKMLG